MWGTMPRRRSMSMSWPRWCISCSFTERIISKRLLEGGVMPEAICTVSARKSSVSPCNHPAHFSPELQHLDSLVLGAAFFFLRRQALHDRGKIESYKRRSAFGGVNLVLEVVRQRDIGQQLAGATGIRGGSKVVFLFGKILRNDESIFTDGAETVGQFFSGVAVHGTSLLSRVTSCPWREQGLRLHFSTPRRLMLWERQPEEPESKTPPV